LAVAAVVVGEQEIQTQVLQEAAEVQVVLFITQPHCYVLEL
jgi:hypothetical protein